MVRWITTSWDDGHRLDWRVADLLDKYGLTGTFYIARDYMDDRLTEAEITELATRHEIGAHTLTHPVLTTVDSEMARQEISGSRDWLQSITGQPVTAFCYPRGAFNSAIRDIVSEAGFQVARTVEQYALTLGDDPLALPTTLQVYPFPLRPVKALRARFDPIRQLLPHVARLTLPVSALRNWSSLALALLDVANTGVWHLWGHSWEVERYDMWDDLERVFAVISQYTHTQAIVTNSQLPLTIQQPMQ